MRDAMLKVAAGDLAVDTGYVQQQDEIGALETFKQQAVDKLRRRAPRTSPTTSRVSKRTLTPQQPPPRMSAAPRRPWKRRANSSAARSRTSSARSARRDGIAVSLSRHGRA